MTAVLNNPDLSTVPAETIEAVRGPILSASERAGKRYAAGPADASPPEDGAVRQGGLRRR